MSPSIDMPEILIMNGVKLYKYQIQGVQSGWSTRKWLTMRFHRSIRNAHGTSKYNAFAWKYLTKGNAAKRPSEEVFWRDGKFNDTMC
jgi:hypothetical protein